MSRKTDDGQPFDQKVYLKEGVRENMANISGRYKKEFVQEFRDACRQLGIRQSDVYPRQTMQEIIGKAKEG